MPRPSHTIIENTYYVHAIRLGLNASGNTVIGANGLDQWSTALWTLGGDTDTSGSSLPGSTGLPTLIVTAAFEDANLCAWKGQQVLLGGKTYGAWA